MANQPAPLSLKRGTTSTLTITIPAEIEPDGATVFFTVKHAETTRRIDDSDRYAIIKKTITDRVGRIFSTEIEPDDTNQAEPGTYVFGITVKDADGVILGTKANGQFIIEPRDTADVGD
jgi:hypothetical protein